MIEVVVLGSGTCVPSARRGAPGVAVRACGRWILIDSGSGTLQRLARAGIDFRQLDCLLYTHQHTDHTADLAPLLFAMNFTPDFQRNRPLTIVGPSGFSTFVDDLARPYPWIEPRDYRLAVNEVSDGGFNAGDARVESATVDHGSNPALAYRISDDQGDSIVVSGDTAYCPAIVKLARGCGVLLLEASVPVEALNNGKHLTAESAGRVARGADAAHLVLYHFYPSCDEADMRGLCTRSYAGPILLAEDGMHLRLERGTLTRLPPAGAGTEE